MKFLFRLFDSFAVLTVHDKNEALCPCIVVPPQRPDLVLATNIPDVEPDVLIRYSLDVEAHCKAISPATRNRVTMHRPVGIVVTD